MNSNFQPVVKIFADAQAMAASSASHAADILKDKLLTQDLVRVVAATGESQIPFLQNLTSDHTIDWSRVELFHLDEYVGIGRDHPASFVRYIQQRIIEPTGIHRYHLLDGTRNIQQVIAEAESAISERAIDVSFVGIGENAHLAFNDPPADFQTRAAFMQVKLDRACRQQQVNEGWFPTLDDVPQTAITMSVRQILKTKTIICSVPGIRKAQAVRATLSEWISPTIPASILRTHPSVAIYLDSDSASQLNQ